MIPGVGVTTMIRTAMSVTPVMKKLSLSIGVLVIFVGIPAMWLWYMFAGPGYYAEFNDIKATLEGMTRDYD